MDAEGEALFRALAERSDAVVFLTDPGVHMFWANDALTKETGFAAADFLFDAPDNPFIHPDDVARIAETIARFVQSDAVVSEPLENRFFTKWGDVIRCRSTVQKVSWHGRPALLFVLRPSAPPASPSSRPPTESYRRLVEEAHDGIAKISVDGRIHFANGRMRELVGLSPVEMGKTSFFDLIVSDERARARLAIERLGLGATTHFEAQLAREGGDACWVAVSGSRLTVDEDAGLVLLFVRDISDARRIESALREAQRLESLGVLAGGVAHDFNNIVTSMRASVGIAEKLAAPETRLAEVLARLRDASRQAEALTAALLAYVGKAPAKSDAVDLATVIDDHEQLLRALISRSVTLTVAGADEPLVVRGDLHQLGQVLVNLVTNAAEAIDEPPGEVTITSRAVTIEAGGDDPEERWFPARPAPGRYAVLAVHDTGRGMSAEVLSRVFDPFFTTKARGRGLGLSATLGILRIHGGALRVRTRPGRGSTFEALLPLLDEAATPRAPVVYRATGDVPRGGTVLYVEDEPSLQKLGRWILEDAGFDVVVAGDGRTGLALFHEDPSRFRALVVDQAMPGMRGDALLRSIRAFDPGIPAVITSGYVDDRASLRDLPHVFLEKPYDGEALERALLEALSAHRR